MKYVEATIKTVYNRVVTLSGNFQIMENFRETHVILIFILKSGKFYDFENIKKKFQRSKMILN